MQSNASTHAELAVSPSSSVQRSSNRPVKLTVRFKPEAGKERLRGHHFDKGRFVSGLACKNVGDSSISEVRDMMAVGFQERLLL
jgi:hypothetical protein